MDEAKIEKFFACLGEIWRDITAIEFLMRCAIAKKDGEEDKIPIPPYVKGKVYDNVPNSFLKYQQFDTLVEEFNQYYPKLKIPSEFVQLRHGFAHGAICKIGGNSDEELFKFKRIKKENKIEIEFSMGLEEKRIIQIRQSLSELRRFLMQI